MATIPTFDQYSTQWANAFTTTPPGNNYAMGGGIRYYPFDCVLAAGTAPVTVGLAYLPPYCTLDLFLSWAAFTGATATETLSIGWAAYKDADGVTVAASAAGLLSAILMTTDGAWRGGALITASANTQSLPVVYRKVFNNREPVSIYATLATANPGVADTLNGALIVVTP